MRSSVRKRARIRMGQQRGAVRRAKLRCGLAAKFREPSRVATGASLSHTCLWSAPEMLDRMGEWATALDLTVSLPLWAVAGSVVLIAFVCAVALRRGASDGRSVPAAVLVLLVALVGWWGARDYFAARGRGRSLRHCGACACGPRRLRAGPVQRLRMAA